MIVLFPFYALDEPLALKNLQWIQCLDAKIDAECLLAYDYQTKPERVAAIAEQVFKKVHLYSYKPPPDRKWPRASNWVFQHVAWHMHANFKEPWLWLESDCVPMKAGWYQAIKQCHIDGGKPFTGHWNEQTQVWNGVSVYPYDTVKYGQKLMLVSNNPWDVMASKDIFPHLNIANHLFQHIWQDDQTGAAYSFKDLAQVQRVVREGVVLFHRVKDGSLQDVLMAAGAAAFEPRPVVDNRIVVQRAASIGDVIQASIVVNKLKDHGLDAIYACDPAASVPLAMSHTLVKLNGKPDVNLDRVYEDDPNAKNKCRSHIFIDAANQQLASRGIVLDKWNVAPAIIAPETGLKLEGPRPHVVVAPRSNSFSNRTIGPTTWRLARQVGQGTWFWSGTDPAPDGYVDLQCRTVESLTEYISKADVVVSVDSAPMHIAAALGKPLVAIEQAVSPELLLSDQRDYVVISPMLGCLNCQQPKCPINPDNPPCSEMEYQLIATAVERKWQSINGDSVSAVIAVYNPNVERLNRCLTQVLPQVNEVIIGVDGDGTIPRGIVQSSRIKWVQNRTGERRGYGRTCNQAIRQSSGRFILLLNDDVFLNRDAVRKMIKAIDDKTAIVGCKLRYPDGTIQHGGGARGPRDIGWGHKDHKKRVGSITARTEMEFVTLAAAIVRRDAFYSVLAFNELYDCYCEDCELCLSVRQKGWKVLYEPGAEGIHEESQTTGPMKKELGKAGYAVFKRRWEWYFKKNANRSLGVFK